MFTGLITEMGEVVSISKKETGARFFLKAREAASEASIGDSISLNGTCLTVVEIKGDILAFDLSDETMRTSNIGRLRAKDPVNIEPALRLNSKLGGHFVTGHIDGVGKIRSKTLSGDIYKITIEVDEHIAGFLVEKGSVAVDGISLTVVDVFKNSFSIVIIPHTAQMTTIGYKNTGDSVNIEVDILGKYVSKFLNKGKDESFVNTMKKEGFL